MHHSNSEQEKVGECLINYKTAAASPAGGEDLLSGRIGRKGNNNNAVHLGHIDTTAVCLTNLGLGGRRKSRKTSKISVCRNLVVAGLEGPYLTATNGGLRYQSQFHGNVSWELLHSPGFPQHTRPISPPLFSHPPPANGTSFIHARLLLPGLDQVRRNYCYLIFPDTEGISRRVRIFIQPPLKEEKPCGSLTLYHRIPKEPLHYRLDLRQFN